MSLKSTVNRERFAGLNFRIFHSFPEYRESFSMNISASLYLYKIMSTYGQGNAKIFPRKLR